MKRVSAADLINEDTAVVCPECGGVALLNRVNDEYSLDCQGDHPPVKGIRAETLLQVAEPGKEVEP